MKSWYVVHTQTGLEDKVKTSLEGKVSTSALQDLIGRVIIPTEQVSEIRSGKRKISQRKFFPGYVLVEMEMDEQVWGIIRTTPGITGFLGGTTPVPLPEEEISKILDLSSREHTAKPKPAIMFEKNENVRIIEGPFSNFAGIVEEVNMERGKLKVMVTIFGRATPVELDFLQVEKI